MRHLVAVYDVADLEPDEVDYLAGEAYVQAEASDGWPGVGHAGVEARTLSLDALEARLVALADDPPIEDDAGIPLCLVGVDEAFRLGVSRAVDLILAAMSGSIEVVLAEDARR